MKNNYTYNNTGGSHNNNNINNNSKNLMLSSTCQGLDALQYSSSKSKIEMVSLLDNFNNILTNNEDRSNSFDLPYL